MFWRKKHLGTCTSVHLSPGLFLRFSCPRRSCQATRGTSSSQEKNTRFSQCRPCPQTNMASKSQKKKNNQTCLCCPFPIILDEKSNAVVVVGFRNPQGLGCFWNFPPSAPFVLHTTPRWTQTISVWPLHHPEAQPGHPVLFLSLQELGDPSSIWGGFS